VHVLDHHFEHLLQTMPIFV